MDAVRLLRNEKHRRNFVDSSGICTTLRRARRLLSNLIFVVGSARNELERILFRLDGFGSRTDKCVRDDAASRVVFHRDPSTLDVDVQHGPFDSTKDGKYIYHGRRPCRQQQ